MATSHHGSTLTFGLLGNFISFVVFLSPVPTFVRIVKKKSTEEFQSLPYVVALFSAMLWLFYALNKSNAILLITINSFGCFIEIIYIALFITFATKKAKKLAVKSVLLLNFGAFSAIVLISYFCVKASSRVTVLGWICLVFGICVFVAPLSIMRRVIVTRSVEFMPFNLSFFLTISAVVWLLYGLLLNDIYVAIPNVVGLAFGLVQMVLYVIYKYFVKAEPLGKNKLPQSNHDISKARPSETINLDIELQAQQAKRKPQPNEYDAAHGDSQGERQTEKITVSVSVAVQPHDQNKSPDMSVPILEGTNDIP